MQLLLPEAVRCSHIASKKKTSLQELHYNNMPITISGDTVTIGKLVFTRSVSGVVTDVHFDGNILELTKELTALNMTPEDVYNGKVCMSNDVLIQNFGMICKQTATSKWYNDADAIKKHYHPEDRRCAVKCFVCCIGNIGGNRRGDMLQLSLQTEKGLRP